MELFVAICSAIAFVALIVYLWNSDRASKNGSASKPNESRSPNQDNEAQTSSIVSGIEFQRIAALEQQIDILTRERAELLRNIGNYAESGAASQLELKQLQASAAASLQRIAALETENSVMRSRLAEFDSECSGRQAEITLLRLELKKLADVEQEAALLRKEQAELLDEIRNLEVENEAKAGKILALRNLEAKQPKLEERLAALSEQNGRLQEEIAQLQSSMRDKIKTQLDGLQELYHKLMPRMN